MTLIISTVTPQFGMLSTDTLVGRYEEGGPVFGTTSCWETAAASAFKGGDRGGAAQPVAVATKIHTFPPLHMIMAATGSAETYLRWANYLTFAGTAGNVRELNAVAPSLLRAMFGGAKHATIVHLGYLPDEGRAAGYIYSSAEGFASVEMTTGHSVTPAPETGAADHDDLAARWQPAAQGVETEALQILIARNQHSACQRGLYGPEAVIGGQLVTARVDASGISLRTSHTFPGFEDQLSEMRRHI